MHMKLRYKFEFVEMNNELVGVPVGDNADEFHGMLKVNDLSKEFIELIDESSNPNEVLDKILQRYPEEKRNEVGQQLCDFLNQLIKEGILDPEFDKTNNG